MENLGGQGKRAREGEAVEGMGQGESEKGICWYVKAVTLFGTH
jgi:hypothetical protein